MTIIAKAVDPPPGKRVGQGGQVECDHPKRRAALGAFTLREGDVCDACGWKEAVPMRVFHADGSSEEVTAGEFFRRIIKRKET